MLKNKILVLTSCFLLQSGCVSNNSSKQNFVDTTRRDEAIFAVSHARAFARDQCAEDNPDLAAISILAVSNEILAGNGVSFGEKEQKALTYDMLSEVYNSSTSKACQLMAKPTAILALRYYQDAFDLESDRPRKSNIMNNIVALGQTIPLSSNTIEDFRTRVMELRS